MGERERERIKGQPNGQGKAGKNTLVVQCAFLSNHGGYSLEAQSFFEHSGLGFLPQGSGWFSKASFGGFLPLPLLSPICSDPKTTHHSLCTRRRRRRRRQSPASKTLSFQNNNNNNKNDERRRDGGGAGQVQLHDAGAEGSHAKPGGEHGPHHDETGMCERVVRLDVTMPLLSSHRKNTNRASPTDSQPFTSK